MNKRNIAIFIYDLHCGGIEKSLVDLLKKMDYDRYQVDLIMLSVSGQFLEEIPPEVSIIHYEPEQFVSMHVDGHIKKEMLSLLAQRKMTEFIRCLYLLGIERLLYNKKRWEFVCKRFLKKSGMLPKQYDVALDYQGLGSSILGLPMVAKKIKAKRRVTWIHQDINYISSESKKLAPYIHGFDKVFCVSSSAKEAFLTEFPEYTDKTDVLYNVVDTEKIKALSEEPIDFEIKGDILKILSVGRLDHQKGYDIALNSLARIKDEIPPFVYMIVGGGDALLGELQDLADRLGIKENVLFAGRKDNPYPYYKEADIYLQPSRSEGFCITLAEAKIFGLPIITTDFAGAREQIVNMQTGIITECSEEKIDEALLELTTSKKLQETFANNLKNAGQLQCELSKLYSIFDQA